MPATTLPFPWYSDPEIFRKEQDLVFRRSWHYVGHRGMLPAPGSFFPAELAGVPVVVTRDRGGAIHALANVCRHRGAVVCEEAGAREALRCPYHGWTYELDGSLRSAPRSDREPDFDPAALPLRSLPVAAWGPFLFAAPSEAVEPFEDVIGTLPGLMADLIDVDSLRFLKRVHADYRANWKVCVENFLECYHCRIAHPGFSRVIDTDPEDYRLVPAVRFSSQYGPVREGWTGPFDPIGPIGRGQFHFLYPSTTVNVMPGRSNLSIGPVVPTGPGTTHRFLDYFVGADVDEDWIESMLAFDDQVGLEDRALVESVQRGMESGALPEGRLFVDSEALIAAFDDWLRARLG